MDFYKAVYIYMLGGLVGTIWETLLNFARGRGFVYCNGSILTPFNFVSRYRKRIRKFETQTMETTRT